MGLSWPATKSVCYCCGTDADVSFPELCGTAKQTGVLQRLLLLGMSVLLLLQMTWSAPPRQPDSRLGRKASKVCTNCCCRQ